MLRREDILLLVAPTAVLGMAMTFAGMHAIIIAEHCPPEEEVDVLLHELAHVWAHLSDPRHRARHAEHLQREPPDYTLVDQAEAEADLFVALVLERPSCTALRRQARVRTAPVG